MRRLAALLFLVLALAGCNSGNKPSENPRAIKTTPPPGPVYCPLTGAETTREFDLDRPALGIKVENSTASRPQAGLEGADIVYEELAEGGITRFLAIYHCNDADPVGPIRSARLVDPDIMLEYQPALMAFSGANAEVKKKVEETRGITGLRHGEHGDAFYRDKARKAPSNLFSTTEDLRGLADLRGKPQIGLQFQKPGATPPAPQPTQSKPGSPAPPPPAPAGAGASVSFSFAGSSTSKYTFDAATGSYLRSHGDTPHVNVKGDQLRAVNVVILKVKVTAGNLRDAAGNTSPEIEVVGEGEAIVVKGGASHSGIWKRADLQSKTTITDAAGAPILMLPGSTWIHLLPQERPVTLG